MSSVPSILVIDDGELRGLMEVIRRMGVDYQYITGGIYPGVVARPRELLITTWASARKLPDFEPVPEGTAEPIWLCMHNQDFVPLRKRLREMGVHYLVHVGLDSEALGMLLAQLLYRGLERRASARLPVGRQVGWRAGREHGKAMLADLAMDAAGLIAGRALAPGTGVAIELPEGLGMGEGFELRGQVTRCIPSRTEGRDPAFSIIVHLDPLEADASQRLERFLAGERLGSPVTPLEKAPRRVAADPVPEPLEPAPAASAPLPPDGGADISERRGTPRSHYTHRVPTLSPHGEAAGGVVLGYDLSMDGMRVARDPGLRVGTEVAVAVHGAPRTEPMLLNAVVVRDAGERGMGLRFSELTHAQRACLADLLANLPALESLDGDDGDGGLVVSEIWVDRAPGASARDDA
jgi:hypothetical protein